MCSNPKLLQALLSVSLWLFGSCASSSNYSFFIGSDPWASNIYIYICTCPRSLAQSVWWDLIYNLTYSLALHGPCELNRAHRFGIADEDVTRLKGKLTQLSSPQPYNSTYLHTPRKQSISHGFGFGFGSFGVTNSMNRKTYMIFRKTCTIIFKKWYSSCSE